MMKPSAIGATGIGAPLRAAARTEDLAAALTTRPTLEEPEEIADAAMLSQHSWRFVVLMVAADAVEMAIHGATNAEIIQRADAVITVAEQRLTGAPFQWGQA